MTYLFQFLRISPAESIGRVSGVDHNLIVDQKSEFFVEFQRPGLIPMVFIVSEDNSKSTINVSTKRETFDALPKFVCSFTPLKPGKYKVN